jgi:hypothetical protein
MADLSSDARQPLLDSLKNAEPCLLTKFGQADCCFIRLRLSAGTDGDAVVHCGVVLTGYPPSVTWKPVIIGILRDLPSFPKLE